MGQELADEDEANRATTKKPNTAFDFDYSKFEGGEDDEEQIIEEYEEWDEEGDVEPVELAPGDLATFNKFFPSQEDSLLRNGWPGVNDRDEDERPGINLADLMLEKILEKEAFDAANEGGAHKSPGLADEDFEIPEKVVQVYTQYVFGSWLSQDGVLANAC